MSDSRFVALRTDPRYRLPSRKQARTTVDPRFKTLFSDHDFRKNATVDRYGRRIKGRKGQDELKRLYKLDQHERPAKRPRTAASPKADNSGTDSAGQDGGDTEDAGQAGTRDVMREGFSESSSEEESGSEEEDASDAAEQDLAEATAGTEQNESIPMGEVSRRIAAVNLDWDQIRAADIMAVAQSFVPGGTRIDSVVIYPSEFGKGRLEREELEGPPREIFASSSRHDLEESDEKSDEDDEIERRLVAEQANNNSEFDTAKLRNYQLERLRYYYAVMTFSSPAAAKAVYDSLDGREYLMSANFFDLRFIPDETDFSEDQPREVCNVLADGYRPNDFKTEALTHSRVRLTWDDDDTTRKDVQRRAFSRAEMDENDMKAYIASGSSDNDSVSSRRSTTTTAQRKEHRLETQKYSMREALGLAAEPVTSRKKQDEKPTGEMQITFSSGLTGGGKNKSVFENEPQDEESTKDRYIRKERDRKQRRKAKMRVIKDGGSADAGLVSQESAAVAVDIDDSKDPEDRGFDDPFFTDPDAAVLSEKKTRRAERAKQREAQSAESHAAEARKAEIELLMTDDHADAVRHFDMRDIEKAEKDAKRKSRKNKSSRPAKATSGEREADDFAVDAADPRFTAMFESHEFAIDPTNAKFKNTTGMKTLLNAGRKHVSKLEDLPSHCDQRVPKSTESRGDDVQDLVKRLKRKRKENP